MPRPKKQKTNRRNQQKHPDLDPKYTLKSRADLLDQDYLHKLSPEELDFMNQFNKEYVSGSVDRENVEENLHNTRELIKDCDDRNNSRNRDVLTREKASKRISSFEELNEDVSIENYEDHLIEELDKKEAREAIDWLAQVLDKDEVKLENKLVNEQKEEES